MTAVPLTAPLWPAPRISSPARRRLYSPPNGFHSSELEILSPPALRRRAMEKFKRIALIDRIWQRQRVMRAIEKTLVIPTYPQGEPPLIDPTEAPARLTMRAIARTCAKHFGISMPDLLAHRRTAGPIRVRQIAMYLARQHTLVSTTQIGHLFHGRDHTTVMHACDKIGRLLETDADLQADIAAIRTTLGIPGAAT